MKISYKGDYALKAVFQLALNYGGREGGILSINAIAKNGDMPTNFLEQILLILRKGGFVKSKRGIKGGFSLARPPKDITVGDIIKFIEGPIGPISCIEGDNYKGCKDLTNCIFRNVWKEVSSAISMVVDNLTFQDLVARYKEKNLKFKYEYCI